MKNLIKLIFACGLFVSTQAIADDHLGCSKLPDHDSFKSALKKAQSESNGGLDLDMWGTLVDRSGHVCVVAYTGKAVGHQWPGSRLISAQKANTANAFSLDGLALSTANLYSATQPGGSLYGLQHSNPVNTKAAYDSKADFETYGTKADPLVGKLIGGVNVFGGGLAIYNEDGFVIGALGVSGDTSCADHNIAWRTRNYLGLDYVTAGVAADKTDQIIFDIVQGKSEGGFGHPKCGANVADVIETLPAISVQPTTPAE